MIFRVWCWMGENSFKYPDAWVIIISAAWHAARWETSTVFERGAQTCDAISERARPRNLYLICSTNRADPAAWLRASKHCSCGLIMCTRESVYINKMHVGATVGKLTRRTHARTESLYIYFTPHLYLSRLRWICWTKRRARFLFQVAFLP